MLLVPGGRLVEGGEGVGGWWREGRGVGVLGKVGYVLGGGGSFSEGLSSIGARGKATWCVSGGGGRQVS